jgi:hypothetical protein
VRRWREALAGGVDLAKAEEELLAQRLAEIAAFQIAGEVLVVDVHVVPRNLAISAASAP